MEQKSSRILVAGGLLALVTAVTVGTLAFFQGSQERAEKTVHLKPHVVAQPQDLSREVPTSGIGKPAPTSAELKDALLDLPLGHTVTDIDIDGNVRIDMNGNLIYDEDLRRFLDFFIGLTKSPEDEAAMREAMAMVMDRRGVPRPVQAEVFGILENYLAYLGAADTLMSENGALQTHMKAVFDELYSLRRRHLGQDVAEGFFGAEEARLRAMFARQQVLASQSVSDVEREQALAAIDQNLPESAREVARRSHRIVNVRHQVQDMREQGATDQEVFAVRAASFGVEGAERLAKLDEERERWQEQLQRYRRQKARIDAQSQLSDAARQEAIEQLRREYFSEQEQKRVSILDRIDASGDGS
ncbi:hypothetical protein EZI54_06220 [Marinobacter halodurans]|uniref:Lipase chaperone n=1 Tax=Marinobacter halodurans TaxID=2528979 RepID=A0ABY1ZRU2_9GAMM|nr:lipase secretion chaperone [Marinobacter halodurans]TBW57633.1 hypothetical protein EZI54_06220 [Marinobacter halodurans]